MLRFLRARKFDVAKAYEMMTNFVLWRKEINLDSLSVSAVGELKYFNSGLMYFSRGRCKNDRPIAFINVKVHDKNDRDLEALKKFCALVMDCAKRMHADNNTLTTMVFDMDGFGLKNMDYEFIKFFIQCFEQYFPETLGVLLLLNAPFIFSGCWRIISPMLDKVVRAKVQFISTKQLPEYIDPKYILTQHGGLDDYSYPFIAVDKNDHVDLPRGLAKSESLEEIKNKTSSLHKSLTANRKEIYQLKQKDRNSQQLHQLLAKHHATKSELTKAVKYPHPGYKYIHDYSHSH